MSDVARAPDKAQTKAHNPDPDSICATDRPEQRLEPFPWRVDLGEHIVGSDHVLDVLVPRFPLCGSAVRSYEAMGKLATG